MATTTALREAELTSPHLRGAPAARTSPDTEPQRVHIDDQESLAKGSVSVRHRNTATTARIVDLGIFLSRVEGLDEAEIALILHVKPRRLTAWIHQQESIPGKAGLRIASLLRIVDKMHQVIEPRGTSRWFRLPMPELGGLSPIEDLSRGGLARVDSLVDRYLDPSYT